MSRSKLEFNSPSKGGVSVSEMTNDISGFVNEEPNSYYRLVIGTDSQIKRINGHSECEYVTAIVIHRRGKGAKYFWRREKAKPMVLRDRIYDETTRSLQTAHELVPDLRKAVSAVKYDLEIHIDVGPIGPTREMIREVVGMVNGNGYVAKTKPDSWAASSVADKHT